MKLKLFILLLFSNFYVSAQGTIIDTLEHYFLHNTYDNYYPCELNANHNPGFIIDQEQLTECFESFDPSKQIAFRFYFSSGPTSGTRLYMTRKDSIIDILFDFDASMRLSNDSYQLIGFLPIVEGVEGYKFTYRYHKPDFPELKFREKHYRIY